MSFDAFDAATAAGERSNRWFGLLTVHAKFVVLIKGQGKHDYDPNIHDEKDRRTQIDISLNPIDDHNMPNLIERSIIAESKEWNSITWPSARDLGLANARELDGKFVLAEMVETGRKWTNREGDEVKGTTFKFIAFYDDIAACTDAFLAERGGSQQVEGEPDDYSDVPFDTNGNSSGQNDAEKETAKAFLPALVKASAGDLDKLAEMLGSTAVVKKYFTTTSPEVQELLQMEAA